MLLLLLFLLYIRYSGYALRECLAIDSSGVLNYYRDIVDNIKLQHATCYTLYIDGIIFKVALMAAVRVYHYKGLLGEGKHLNLRRCSVRH